MWFLKCWTICLISLFINSWTTHMESSNSSAITPSIIIYLSHHRVWILLSCCSSGGHYFLDAMQHIKSVSAMAASLCLQLTEKKAIEFRNRKYSQRPQRWLWRNNVTSMTAAWLLAKSAEFLCLLGPSCHTYTHLQWLNIHTHCERWFTHWWNIIGSVDTKGEWRYFVKARIQHSLITSRGETLFE